MAHNAAGRLLRLRSSLQQQPSTFFRQTRNNSTSSASHVAVPSFGPASTPELEQQLKHIRDNLFVPMYMTEHQRRLMFRERYRERLLEEQIKVTIGDDEFTLQPRKRQELPNKETVYEAVEKMKTPRDFQNLVPLLIGLRKSNISIRTPQFEKWIRLAGKSGAVPVIIELAKQFRRTGFSLSEPRVALQLALVLYERAEAAGFKGDAVTAALRQAEQAALLMNSPEHTNKDPTLDPKRQPFFIATCLQLSAACALDEGNAAKDPEQKTVSYAQKVMGNWSLVKLECPSEKWQDRDDMLLETSLIRKGMALALKVPALQNNRGGLRNVMQQRLAKIDDLLRKQIARQTAELQDRTTRGIALAKAVLEE